MNDQLGLQPRESCRPLRNAVHVVNLHEGSLGLQPTHLPESGEFLHDRLTRHARPVGQFLLGDRRLEGEAAVLLLHAEPFAQLVEAPGNASSHIVEAELELVHRGIPDLSHHLVEKTAGEAEFGVDEAPEVANGDDEYIGRRREGEGARGTWRRVDERHLSDDLPGTSYPEQDFPTVLGAHGELDLTGLDEQHVSGVVAVEKEHRTLPIGPAHTHRLDEGPIIFRKSIQEELIHHAGKLATKSEPCAPSRERIGASRKRP